MPAGREVCELSAKSCVHWWLRLAVAAFLLSAWVVVGVGSGIAWADKPSPSADASSSASSAAPHKKAAKESKKPDPKADKADTDTDTAPDHTATATAPELTSAADSDAAPKPHTRQNPRRAHLTVASSKPSKPAKSSKPLADDPKPSAPENAAPSSAVTTAKIASLQPTAAKADPVAPQTSAPIRLPKPREVVGLVSDVGVVAASVVYTAADTVAKVFGPHSFLGAPYALATAVANSAAAVGRTFIGAPPGSIGTGPFRVTYGILDG